MSTKQQIKEEIVRCGRDPAYFVRKHVRIEHPKRGLIPFALYDYQEQLLGDYVRHRFNIVLKARQLGISEATAAYAAWLILFHRHKNVLVIATKAATAKNIIKKVRTTIKKLPSWIVPSRITVDNRMSIELDNGSGIKATASSSDAGRSEALSLLIIDEAAHIKNIDELWTGLMPTVSTGGQVIVLSTPNGIGNVFHRVYSGAEQAANDFHPTKLMWWVHPDHIHGLEDDPERPGKKTSPWYRKEILSMTPRDVAQELNCDFLSSGETVIAAGSLEWVDSTIRPPESLENWDRRLHVWDQPTAQGLYFLTADVARGDGNDHSTFHVWDQDMNQVAEYQSQSKPDAFAALLVETGLRYNRALIVVENNSYGLAVLEHIRLAKYPNVYHSRKGDMKAGEGVDSNWGPASDDLVAGHATTSATRPLMIAKLEEYLRRRCMNVRSRRLLDELRTFVWNNGRPEAARGKNDDLVIAAALAAWMKDTFITPNFAGIEMQRSLVANIGVERTKNTAVRGLSKNPDLVPWRTMGSFTQPNQHQMRLPNGAIVDVAEILGLGRRR